MSQDERTRLVRVHVVAEVTGLSCGMITRLADAGTIPHLRPNPRGNRYYALPAVLRALGLPQETTREDDVKNPSGRIAPRDSATANGRGEDRRQAHRGRVLDDETYELSESLEAVLKRLREGRRNLERAKPSPCNSRAKILNELHTMILERVAE